MLIQAIRTFNGDLVAHRGQLFLISEPVMNFDDPNELKDRLRRIVRDCVAKGPGYAQEGVVLREARNVLRPRELAQEQMILEAWHRLFVDGELGWGHNLDNPGAPFFHSVPHQTATAVGAR